MVNVILSFEHSCALELRCIIINMKESGIRDVVHSKVLYFGFDVMKLTFG